jgi:hypothetical protein
MQSCRRGRTEEPIRRPGRPAWRKRWRRLGQVIIPSLFLFPTFMLFVYLIYETAKLSREKIRHQFAIDAAVFVEMTNYSDFLNRTAYVNGAFPMRIFDEGFYDTNISCDKKDNCQADAEYGRLWTILCRRGAFPQPNGSCVADHNFQYSSEHSWNIQYATYQDGMGQTINKNDDPDSMKNELGQGCDQAPCFTIIRGIGADDEANRFWFNYTDSYQIFQLYSSIYGLLGSVEDAQYHVLNRLAAQHTFLKKSYWLNTGSGSDVSSAAKAATLFESHMDDSRWANGSKVGSALHYHCYQYVHFYGNQATGNMFQPWQVWHPTTGAIRIENTIDGCTGLFQFLTVDPSIISTLRSPVSDSTFASRGVEVDQPWGGQDDNNAVTTNYFSHRFTDDFNGLPTVHVSVAVDGFGGAKPAVWPNPTPKFQVRTYP